MTTTRDTPTPTPTPVKSEPATPVSQQVEVQLDPFARHYKLRAEQLEHEAMQWIIQVQQLENRERLLMQEIGRLRVEIKLARGEKVPEVKAVEPEPVTPTVN